MNNNSPASSKVLALLRTRAEKLLYLDNTNGMGSNFTTEEDEPVMKIGNLEAWGVELDSTGEDTFPRRNASVTLEVLVTVSERMINLSSNLHGGAAAYLVDISSSLPLLCLSGNDRWPSSGVTTNLSLYYLSAAPLDAELSIVSTVIQQGIKVAVMTCEVRNAITKELLIIATHVKQDNVKNLKLKL